MLKSLSGRFLVLTIIFILMAEILLFVPSLSRFRENYLIDALSHAQIAALVLEADDAITPELESELLEVSGVYTVAMRRDGIRMLVLSSLVPQTVMETFDLRTANTASLIVDAFRCLLNCEGEVVRVIGVPVGEAGLSVEITMSADPLYTAMVSYSLRIFLFSVAISIFTGVLLFLMVRNMMVKPIHRAIRLMHKYTDAPEDAHRIIRPSSKITELREAEIAFQFLQTQLTAALKHKERLALLGSAVAKISHDLRNILSSAQLFADRLEASEDKAVRTLAPKLIRSMTRAISLCENTLAYGRVHEPSPTLGPLELSAVIEDVFETEKLAAQGEDIVFKNDVPAGLIILADGEQIYRVISNLTRNARQALHGNGQGGQIVFDAFNTGKDWQITITDTGPGLSDTAQKNLFTAFQGGTRKDSSGLGLAISAELIRGHGGQLELQKTDAQGTTFMISLPQRGNYLSE